MRARRPGVVLGEQVTDFEDVVAEVAAVDDFGDVDMVSGTKRVLPTRWTARVSSQGGRPKPLGYTGLAEPMSTTEHCIRLVMLP